MSNLSLLYFQISKISFKMENIDHICKFLEPDDFMVSIDLTDAFFSIPVHDNFKKYPCFHFNNQIYQFKILPFGLTSTTRMFS